MALTLLTARTHSIARRTCVAPLHEIAPVSRKLQGKIVCFLLVAVLLASVAQAQAAPDEVLAKLCADRSAHHLTVDETAVVRTVVKHYRQFEWNATQARRDRTFAHADYVRHAIPSFASPQILFLETIPHRTWFDPLLRVEFERRGMPHPSTRTLLSSLRSLNAQSYSLRLPQLPGIVGLNCRGAVGLKYGVANVPGDFANLAAGVAVSRPAFDDQRKMALILAANTPEYHRDLSKLECILLRATGAGAWEIVWHVNAGPYMPRAEAATTAVTREDFPVFDAVLRELLQKGRFSGRKCVAVVNQTRTDEFPLPDELKNFAAAAADQKFRSAVSLYIGAYTPPHPATLVQREVVGSLENGRGCGDAVSFSFPGYESDGQRAVVNFWLQTTTREGTEFGIGWAVLSRRQIGWRVDREVYQRSMLWPR